MHKDQQQKDQGNKNDELESLGKLNTKMAAEPFGLDMNQRLV